MPTHYSPYGYPYPDPIDPLKNGAADIGALANANMAPELYPGQPCLAGTLPSQQQFKVRQVVYNYQPATDGFGLASIPLPFTQCCLTAMVMPRNFRQNVVSIALAQEYCTPSNLSIYVRNAAGQGVASTNCDLTIIAWGY